MEKRTAIIIGAGPAGLTTARELLMRTEIRPIVLEMSEHMGGIARTVNYKGNRLDISGHRFFSKSDRVMEWWLDFLPLQRLEDSTAQIAYRRRQRAVTSSAAAPDPSLERLACFQGLLRPRRPSQPGESVAHITGCG
jgi:protoporphyrinogen oxidase